MSIRNPAICQELFYLPLIRHLLSNLLMLLEMAQLLAIGLGLVVLETEQRGVLDWHGDRGWEPLATWDRRSEATRLSFM